MNDLISLFKKDLYLLVEDLIDKKFIDTVEKNNISIDFSSKSKKGDLSTNIFLMLSKKCVDKNFDLKTYLLNYFKNLNYVEKIEIAEVGFINLFIKKNFLLLNLMNLDIKNIKKNILLSDRKNINIEFVSANPTGPIHIAHMRGAVLGDVLSSILKAVGHDVTREYYVNDAGSQIQTLGISIFKRYNELFGKKIELKENEYPGNYIIDIAQKIKNSDGDKWLNYNNINIRNKYFERYGVDLLIENIKNDLALINIKFAKFTFESKVVEDKYIEKVFNILNEKKLIYEGFLEKPLGDDSENWEPRKQLLFKSKNFSDDVDRPFKKANGEWTYFANDTAYHYEKFSRKYDKLINIWGADHIGYISRMKSIVDVISNKTNYLEIFICQIVRLIKNNKLLKMSKRSGNFIELKEIYNEVGKDPLRYFMVSSKSESPMDFNLDKVIERNKDNPVFYCQYAYARASSIIRKSNEIESLKNFDQSFDNFHSSLISEHEWKIIFKLITWPYVLKQTAETKQPHRLTNYLEDLCSHFHSFWNKGKDEPSLRMIDINNLEKTISRLIWIDIFKKTLKEIFDIIDINSPENM